MRRSHRAQRCVVVLLAAVVAPAARVEKVHAENYGTAAPVSAPADGAADTLSGAAAEPSRTQAPANLSGYPTGQGAPSPGAWASPGPQGQNPYGPTESSANCEQTCPFIQGFSCLGNRCLGPDAWLAMARSLRDQETLARRTATQFALGAGVSVFSQTSGLVGIGGVGIAQASKGFSRYLGGAIGAKAGQFGLVPSGGNKGSGSSDDLPGATLLGLDVSLVVTFMDETPVVYLAPVLGVSHVWFGSGSGRFTGSDGLEHQVSFHSGTIFTPGGEFGTRWGRDEQWRFGMQILGTVGGAMHGPLGLFALSYGLL